MTQPGEPPRERHPADSMALPAWVPTIIGVILVAMAALAVYTGIRYRNPTLANNIMKRRTSTRAVTNGGPPGEPEPGGSLVFPGANAEASEPIAAPGAATNAHIAARRAMITNVFPDDAMIYVNDLAIGQAKQFNTAEKVYDFPAPGSYTIRVVAPGYKERQFVVTAAEDARQEIARIDARLVRQ